MAQEDVPQQHLRWFCRSEICGIIRNYHNYRLTTEPQLPHKGCHVLLYDKLALPSFPRNDGHNWILKNNGPSVKETVVKLPIAGKKVLYGYYAHGEDNERFQRRRYWIHNDPLVGHIVLVHYRRMKRNLCEDIQWQNGLRILHNSIKEVRTLFAEQIRTRRYFSTFCECYSTVTRMCTQENPLNYRDEVVQIFHTACKRYINSDIFPDLRRIRAEDIVERLVDPLARYKSWLRCLASFFGHLNSIFGTNYTTEAGVTNFSLLVYNRMRVKARHATFELIRQEREGFEIQIDLLIEFAEIATGNRKLGEADFYAARLGKNAEYEEELLKATTTYYSRKAAKWIREESHSEYMMNADNCLMDEERRVSHYHASSEKDLLENVKKELLVEYATKLLGNKRSGFKALLRDDRVEDLSRMCRLYGSITKGLELLVKMFEEQVKEEKELLVEKCTTKEILIRKLNDLHKRGEAWAKNYLANNADCLKALRDIFEMVRQETFKGQPIHEIITAIFQRISKEINCLRNQDHTTSEKSILSQLIELYYKVVNDLVGHLCSKDDFQGLFQSSFRTFKRSMYELVAEYFDDILVNASHGIIDDPTFVEKLDKGEKILVFFDRSIIEYLAKRFSNMLVNDRNIKDEYFERIIYKLDCHLEDEHRSSFRGMLEDIRESQEYSREFQHSHSHTFEVDFRVIQGRNWPGLDFDLLESRDFVLADELGKCSEEFGKFFKSNTTMKTWNILKSLGTITMTVPFQQKSIDLVMGPLQVSVLMLFNEDEVEWLHYKEIKRRIELGDDDTLVRVLKSLSCYKYKILKKEPDNEEISFSDKFAFNPEFTDRADEIEVHLPPVVREKKDRFSGGLAIGAWLTRTLKHSPVGMTYESLFSKCTEDLGDIFEVTMTELKVGIERLLEYDYIERDRQNLELLKYKPQIDS